MTVDGLRLTCPRMPVQIEGQLPDGRWVYFRARYDHWGVGVGETLEAAWDDYDSQPGVPWDGASHMPHDEAWRLLRETIGRDYVGRA